jgi:hypothetical protein
MPSNYKTVINFRDGIQVDTDDLISNNGLVGIGSTIPRQQLDVRGNVIVDQNTELNNLKVVGYTTYYGNLNVSTGSSVGIGTTVPEEAFQVGVGTEGATISLAGIITAQKFVGDGSELTGIPASVWVNPSVGQTIYSLKDVGIGTTGTRNQASFGVGYEIYMDANSGVGTFEGIVAKNLTVTNTTGAGQGNVNADVGTFSTVTATTSISAPSFIGTITNATRSVVAAGLTDNPNIGVNYIAGVGGTFTGITSFSTLQITGGIVANGGIITATTFAGTASTAVGAQTAYSILGDPTIQVEQLQTTGLVKSIIKGTGVSTIGQDLLVGEFLGVGDTSSAIGQAAGFIGTVRVNSGDLFVAGSLSIGGTFVGDLELGGTQNVNVLNVGAGLSVSGISTLTGDVTGGGNLSFGGTITGTRLRSTAGAIIGGGLTCNGGGIEAQGPLILGAGGGLIIGSGITMNGPIAGASSITATGAVSGGKITGSDGSFTNLNVLGVSTLGISSVSDLQVGGSLNVQGIGTISTGVIKIDGVTGIGSFTSLYAPAGISNLGNLQLTDGSSTYMFGKYLGINTNSVGGASRGINEGLEFYDNSELFCHTTAKGIGIGSTSGQRADTAQLYVGYGRSDNGQIRNVQAIFEGSVGIGTTTTANSLNTEKFEIYKNTTFWNNHTGIGGTIGIANTTTCRIGINSGEPGGSLDMRYSGEAFILPRNFTPSGGVSGNPAYVDVSDGDYEGSMWYDGANKKYRVRFADGEPIGLSTELGYDLLEERAWLGKIVTSNSNRLSEAPTNPPERPPGWSTSNQVYYSPTEQLQIFGSDNIWRSLVGSATTGVSIIIDGTTAKLNVAGVGSVSLGTLS